MKRVLPRSVASLRLPVVAFVVLLSIVGYVVTSKTIRDDRESDAAERAEADSGRMQATFGRARAIVVGLGGVLADERPNQRRFTQLAGGITGSIGLVDALWVEGGPGSRRVTFTTRTGPVLRPGVDVSRWPALAAALGDASTEFEVTASEVGSLAGRAGFFLVQAGSYGRSRGHLVLFAPRGWLTESLQGDRRRIAVSLDDRPLEGLLSSPAAASASLSTLGRRWRVDTGLESATGLQSLLPWLALTWPGGVAIVAFLVARGVSRRREAEREFERVFNLIVDLLCVAGFDGYLKRVNPAWARTFGFTEQELLSRPFIEFVHPDDRPKTMEAVRMLVTGQDLVEFENRHLCRDGSARWLQWTSRPVLEHGLAYAAARDVTDRKRREAEEAALRRLATLVARAGAPTDVFDAVTREVGLLCDADLARMERFEPDRTFTAIAVWSRSGEAQLTVGARFPLEGTSTAAQVYETGRAARVDSLVGASGPIAREGQALGIRSSIGAPIIVGGRTWGAIAAFTTRDAPFPPATESRIADFTELVATAVANAEAQADLVASRARLVAAADEARRRVVRDLHDGVQQRLVHTILTLSLAQSARESGDEAGAAALAKEALEHAEQTNHELRELAQGILPRALTDGGLSAGVDALVSRMHVPVTVEVNCERFAPEIEASAYFVVAEALTNAAKHADASTVAVEVKPVDGVLSVCVRDDGVGGAEIGVGSGLAGIKDRVEALGGRIHVDSPPGGGTSVRAELPVGRGAASPA